MINLLSTEDAQTISFIPRIDEWPVSLIIKRETTGIETTFTPTFFLERYYKTTSLVFDLVENEFYSLTIKDIDGNIIYIDSVFCTNQDSDDYSINNDTYIYG